MRQTESRSVRTGVREPSPPFGHVSWREAVEQERVVEHAASDDIVVLAETVMGRDGEAPPRQPRIAYLVKIARYPLWAISVRALVGAAVLLLPAFLYGARRYHYLVKGGAQEYRFDQNALLAGLVLALVGALVGMLAGALWGLLVVRHARGSVRKLSKATGDRRGGGT